MFLLLEHLILLLAINDSAARLDILLLKDSAASVNIAAANVHSAAKWISMKRYLLYFGQQYMVDNILPHVLS